MVNRSTIAGVAGVMMMIAAGSVPAVAQDCPAGCDGATNWTGFWLGAGIGANADMIGHQWSTVDALGAPTGNGTDDSRGGDGFFGTVGIGYDWQVRDRFIMGAFADFDFGNTEHSEVDYFGTAGPYGWDYERNTTWTIGARFGLATSNTSMVYGLIGYSQTNADIAVFENDGVGGSFRISRELDFSGLVLGAGLEQDLGNGFSLKGEYRYTNYGEEHFGSGIANLAGTEFETDDFDLDTHSFRLTLAYKFHRGGEVVEEVSYKDMPPAPSYTQPYK